MEQTSPRPSAARGASAIDVAVIQPAGVYSMFVASALSPDGALLSGGLLLEIGEEVLLELRLGTGPLRLRARVLAIVPGQETAMQVEFIAIDDATRQRLHRGA